MRLWSIHPCYLDPKGLVALWREALLAQKVLLGNTRGYRNHPQLTRFRDTDDPAGAIGVYLHHVADEAERRGYRFDRGRIIGKGFNGKMSVTHGQVEYEFNHLMNKLKARDPGILERLMKIKKIKIHPIMQQIRGEIEVWERR